MLERPPVETSSSPEAIIPIGGEPSSGADTSSPIGTESPASPSVPAVPVTLDPAARTGKLLSAYVDNECLLVNGVLGCRSDIAFAVESEDVKDVLSSISLGEEHLCGIDAAGSILCYGEGINPHEEGTACSFNDCGQSIVPAGTYKDVAASDQFTCGLLMDGSVDCWGEPPSVIAGTFTDIDAYGSRLCGLTTDSRIVCNDSSASTLTGSYTQLAVGPSVCGVTSGAVHCAGLDNREGEFARISVGKDFACGLSIDGTASCWGSGLRVPPPAGAFTAIASGDDYACGLRSDGALICWGENRGDGGAVLQCELDHAKLSGTLAGSALDADWSVSGAIFEYGSGAFNWELNLRSDSSRPGLLLLSGNDETMTGNIPRFALNDGQSAAVTNGVFLPPDDQAPSVYCVGGGTVRRESDEALVDLTGVGALGTCPGVPVDGEISVCFGLGDGCGEDSIDSVVGTLDGQPMDTQLRGYLGLGGSYQAGIAGGFLMWNEVRDFTTTAATGPVSSALIFTDPAGPHGGAVYCAGDASSWEEVGGDSLSENTLVTMRGLSKLGTCQGAAPGADQLSGCVR